VLLVRQVANFVRLKNLKVSPSKDSIENFKQHDSKNTKLKRRLQGLAPQIFNFLWYPTIASLAGNVTGVSFYSLAQTSTARVLIFMADIERHAVPTFNTSDYRGNNSLPISLSCSTDTADNSFFETVDEQSDERGRYKHDTAILSSSDMRAQSYTSRVNFEPEDQDARPVCLLSGSNILSNFDADSSMMSSSTTEPNDTEPNKKRKKGPLESSSKRRCRDVSPGSPDGRMPIKNLRFSGIDLNRWLL
jgi:hypothetical protein